jgi:hypothetical protein
MSFLNTKTILLASTRRGRGQSLPPKVDHFDDPPTPSRFYMQLDEDEIYMLLISIEFKPQLRASFPDHSG